MINISLATHSDIPALCRLLTILFSQEVEFSPNPEAQCRGLTWIIDNSDIGHIFVARQHDEVVGMVSLLYTVSTALGSKVALLEDMIVSPLHRSGGVGSQLLKHAISFAHHNDCQRITLLTDSRNEAAQRFYQRHGFVCSPMMPLRLSLEFPR